MPPRRSRTATATEEPCGSGQSRESIEKDKAAQPALLAAAARKTIQKKSGKRAHKVFVFKKPDATTTTNSPRRSLTKDKPAMISFYRAKYQKGDKKDALSGNVYVKARPRYAKGANDKWKEKGNAKMLYYNLRWNDEPSIKAYTGPISTVEQAIMLREALKMVSPEDEKDIIANGPTDEEIAAVFDFPEVKTAHIEIVKSFDLDGEDTVAIGKDTYVWKNILDKKGFKFEFVTKMWHAPAGTDTDELEAMMEEYGFAVDTYDTAEVHE